MEVGTLYQSLLLSRLSAMRAPAQMFVDDIVFRTGLPRREIGQAQTLIVSRRSRAASHDTAFAHSREGGGGELSSRARRVRRTSFRATLARAARSARARHVCSNASASAGLSSAARAAHAARFCATAAAKAARIGESLVIAPPAEGVDHVSQKRTSQPVRKTHGFPLTLQPASR